MTRFLAAFLLLFAGGAGAIWLLPSPPHAAEPHPAVAAPGHADVQSSASDRPQIRVVYPALGTNAAPIIAPAIPAVAISPVTATEPSTTSVAAVYPQAGNTGAADADPATPVNAATQVGISNVNINTASVEALNGIPGAGRIGRTIASHRPYRSVEDLLTKRVVRKDVYERIKAQIAAE